MSKIRVMLDPGHGGQDRANRGPTGYIEADGVLTLSLYSAEYLKASGFEVALTRDTDKSLTLYERAKKGQKFNADILISNHTNAFNGERRGATAIRSVTRPEDQSLANAMIEAVADEFNVPNSSAWTRSNSRGNDWYGIIRNSINLGIERVIIMEHLYHDNRQDEALLKQENNLKKLAELQAKVLCKEYGYTFVDPFIQEDTDDLHRVQVGAYSKRENAEAQIEALKKAGYDHYLAKGKDGLFRVQVGAFKNYQNAKDLEARLKRSGFSTWITNAKNEAVTETAPKKETVLKPGDVEAGDRVQVKEGAKSYEGVSLKSSVYGPTYKVHSTSKGGERVYIGHSSIKTAFNVKDLKKA